MRLTQHTDYALRVLFYAAIAPDRLVTTREVSEAYAISLNHLVKVVNALGHAGYLELIRGRTGGIRLARPADQIPLGDVVRAMESDLEIAECFDAGTNRCIITPACQLKRILHEATDAFLGTLNRYTLADCVGGRHAILLREILGQVPYFSEHATNEGVPPADPVDEIPRSDRWN
jgi:Rrf2 family nitric oxide-sensitive transcriptional repressor